ncbi:hypothetical protein D3C80_915060 [compost metagenome]
MALVLVLVEDRLLEPRFVFGAERMAAALALLTLDLSQHPSGLFGTHHANSRVRPHPQKAWVVGAAAHTVVTGTEAAADDYSEFRYLGAGHGGDQLGAVLGDPAGLVFLADHETGNVLQEQQRDATLAGQLNEVRAFLRGFGKQDPIVGEDRHRVAVQVGKATHQRGAEQRLELIEHRGVNQTGDHFTHIERLLGVGRNHTVQLLSVVQRGNRCLLGECAELVPIEVGHAAPGNGQGMFVVVGIVVSNATGLAVHIGATEVLGADHFTGGGFYQRWAGEENRRLLANHDRLIGHGWHVSAAGGARAHDHGDLRNAQGTHVGLVEEDPTEVFAIGEHFILTRQVGAARVHQVQARQAVLQGDGLGAQVLFHR